MKNLGHFLVWVMVLSGVLWGYEGWTGKNLLSELLGSQVTTYAEIVVGLLALYTGYLLLTHKLKTESK